MVRSKERENGQNSLSTNKILQKGDKHLTMVLIEVNHSQRQLNKVSKYAFVNKIPDI